MIKNLRSRLKYIFPVLIAIMVIGFMLSRVYRPDPSPPEPEARISAAEANDYIGTAAEVCGQVASADYLPQIGGEPTFLNFGRPHPDQLFTAVIWARDRMKWSAPPEQLYERQEICVTGRIERHEGTPQIIVEHPDQISRLM